MRSLALVALLFCLAQPASGQARFGLGMSTSINSTDGFGLGLHTRTSVPLNQDFSFAFDAAATGFVLEGWRDARYVFEPQVAGIVTLPARNGRAVYFLAGFGGYIPLVIDDGSKGGPTMHAGTGYVVRLRETTVYYELNPSVIIGESRVDVGLPFRFGVIF